MKSKRFLIAIVKIALYLNAILTMVVVLANTVFDTSRRIHPKYNYVIYKNLELDSYYLSSTSGSLQPEWLDYVGMQGIFLDGTKLYVQYHANEFYLINLDAVERSRLEKLPPDIKLIEPKVFYDNLK